MDKLAAWIGDKLVGHLVFDARTGLFAFDYADAWQADPLSYPFSPALPFARATEDAVHSRSVRNFFENLMPEGAALDAAATANGLAKSNLFGLIRALGRESAGAIALLPEGELPDANQEPPREIAADELSRRIRERDHIPFNVWDGKVRLSIAGLQDKIAVYMNAGRMYLAQGGGITSTHIVKPLPRRDGLATLVANEHFCMKLAEAVGLRPAEASIIRVPEPVLLIRRFDRRLTESGVIRTHVIDACQALDLPPAYKYERNFGSNPDVRHIRDGASLAKLFGLSHLAAAPALFNATILRWTLFQYLIGNSDAHGKNISFYVTRDGIIPAPPYDLVSVVAYKDFDHDLAMGISDAFTFDDVMAFQWADFVRQCNINRTLLVREMRRMAASVTRAVQALDDADYTDEEKTMIASVRGFVLAQCEKMNRAAVLIPGMANEELIDSASK
jgi:serine/threonine-protein kinase HipA